MQPCLLWPPFRCPSFLRLAGSQQRRRPCPANHAVAAGHHRRAVLCFVCDRPIAAALVQQGVSGSFTVSALCAVQHWFAAGAGVVSVSVRTDVFVDNAGRFVVGRISDLRVVLSALRLDNSNENHRTVVPCSRSHIRLCRPANIRSSLVHAGDAAVDHAVGDNK